MANKPPIKDEDLDAIADAMIDNALRPTPNRTLDQSLLEELKQKAKKPTR